MNENSGNSRLRVYDRDLLLHGRKRNEVLTLAEVEQYGSDSFADKDYVSIYGMPPREWYRLGVRLLGRTAVECTRDALGDRISRDVASVALCMPSKKFTVIDPFAGSCNTLFWLLRHIPDSQGIGFEAEVSVFELTRRNLAAIGHSAKVVHGNYVELLSQIHVPRDRSIVVFVAPPWGTALDESQGLDLSRTTPPVCDVIEQIHRQFQSHKVLFATQVYQKVTGRSLQELQSRFEWTEMRIYDMNEEGRNHGIVLGTKGWSPDSRHAKRRTAMGKKVR